MESSTTAIIEVKDIWKTFLTGGTSFSALRGIDLKVMPNELLAIMGASGSGKSTFMNVLGCLDRPTKGEYFFNGIATTTKNNTKHLQQKR